MKKPPNRFEEPLLFLVNPVRFGQLIDLNDGHKNRLYDVVPI
jgi:hypothetical protein